MGNRNYISGRNFEYTTMQEWRDRGYIVARTAGSHSLFDVLAIRPDRKPEVIQCKKVSTQATARRLETKFRTETVPSEFYHQVLTIKIKGTKAPLQYTV